MSGLLPCRSSVTWSDAAMPQTPLELLRSTFGFEAFRGHQAEVIDHVVAGGDALVVMPTGGGKSLCYQVPGLLRSGVAVVVSPLIALMQDQVAALRQLGVRAAALNSTLDLAEAAEVEKAIRLEELDIVYVAPERLLTDRFLHHLDHCRVALFAIDEAHCVSQWGHDFRPEYLQLTLLHERYPDVPRIALTATADHQTRRDIVDRLALGSGRIFVAGFDRPNIRYRVAPKQDARSQLLRFIEAEHRGDSGIVYCNTRRAVDETATWLTGRGIAALPYHAGLDRADRAAHQDRFLREEGLVMVATIAFGMGIDKPDVRFVAHLDLPKSLEAYYQETGRAGRDGLASDAWMVYGLADVVRVRQLIEGSAAPDTQKRLERQKLDALLGFCETVQCRRQVLLAYFGDSCEPCGNCDTCLEPPEVFDGTEVAQKLLSCVYRTGQRFGAGHVIDILRGRDSERIRQLGHDRLSTWGIGKELSANQWRSVVRQLLASGLLVVDPDGHGALHVAAECRAVLKGERRIALRREVSGRPAGKSATSRSAVIEDGDRALFEELRALRRRLADEQGVPPYVIFHDSTLADMAQRRPGSRQSLANVSGVGGRKLELYGDAFLEVITHHQSMARVS